MKTWLLIMVAVTSCGVAKMLDLQGALEEYGFEDVKIYQPASCPRDKPEGRWFTGKQDGHTHFGYICCELADGGNCHVQESRCGLCE
jgi:hypothetical protein